MKNKEKNLIEADILLVQEAVHFLCPYVIQWLYGKLLSHPF